MLQEIIDNLPRPIKWTIINCNDNQIDRIMEFLYSRKIVAHRFTMDEDISDRDYLLENFAKGKYQILVSMECLDEGVDVPQAKISILMASSLNTREYIQRIGRVLRRYPGKKEAIIYDIIVKPSNTILSKNLKDVEWKIFNKELDRYEYIASSAINNIEVLKKIFDVRDSL